MISCQTSCTNECVIFFLSVTVGNVILGAGGKFAEPVTSVVLESIGDAGGVSDVGPEVVAESVLGNTGPSADGQRSQVKKLNTRIRKRKVVTSTKKITDKLRLHVIQNS